MPTGYTSLIYEGTNQSLKDFILTCAHGMSPLSHMRDCGIDSPIKNAVPSTYRLKQLKKSEEELKKVNKMSDKEILDIINVEREEKIKFNEEYKAKKIETKKRYENMIEKVNNWKPPTKDFVNFKTFMIDQLKDSIRYDCSFDYFDDKLPEIPSVKKWKKDKIAELKESIKYDKEEYNKEIKRCKKANKWIEDLIKSVN